MVTMYSRLTTDWRTFLVASGCTAVGKNNALKEKQGGRNQKWLERTKTVSHLLFNYFEIVKRFDKRLLNYLSQSVTSQALLYEDKEDHFSSVHLEVK